MKILFKGLSDEERSLWIQSFRDRLPGILDLIDTYEQKQARGKNCAPILRQIFHSTRHTLKGAVNLCRSENVDPEIKNKLKFLLRYLQCLEDKMRNNVDEKDAFANVIGDKSDYQPFFVRMFNMLNNDNLNIY